jgi:hypothetical protein
MGRSIVQALPEVFAGHWSRLPPPVVPLGGADGLESCFE